MKSDIVIIGGGAAGLMAAYAAGRAAADAGLALQVTVLEKMPRPARKVMITGKGRCNFTNVKDWNEFSAHIRTNPALVKPAFYNFTPQSLVDFFESFGLETVVERGDRAFPASHRASDIVDTLISACFSVGVKIETGFEVETLQIPEDGRPLFELTSTDGRVFLCSRLVIATGGLSYPSTGSTGDGLRWAEQSGHRMEPVFPSLTALVPAGYKSEERPVVPMSRWHIPRETPRAELGNALCGVQLKNVGVQLLVEGTEAGNEFGDIDFTDGGIEGPVGFQLSRKAVKSLINGSKVQLVVDLKPGIGLADVTERVKQLWKEVDNDPRSRRLREKEKCRILLGKLMPWDLIPGFTASHPEILTLERRGRADTKVWVNLPSIAKALKEWRFDIVGHVGYERAVVTAGGVSASEVVAKTLESRKVPGLYFCGEVLDMDCDTGGYNLHVAFASGALAGQSSAKSFLKSIVR